MAMECDKNLFLEMSQDQMKKLDEVLQSEQAKALLQETSSKLFVDTVKTVALDEEHATIPSNLETISSLSDLENLDLDHSNPTDLFPVSNDEYVENLASGILPETLDDQALEMEIVLLDHCYSLNPTESSKDQMPAEEINATEIVTEDKEEEIEDATRKEFDNNTTPIRRSLRQIEKVEREQLEKIKAENAELQRREKEEMERLKIQKEVELKQKDEEKEKNFQDLIVQSREQDEPSREPSVKGESVTLNTSLSDALKNESEEAIMHDFCEADIKIDNTKETKKKLRNRRTKSEMKDDDVTPKDSANGNLNVQKSEKIKGRRKKAKLQVQGNIDNNSSSESENVASCEDEKEKEISSSTNKTLKNKVSKSIVDRKRRMSSPKKRCKVDTVSEDLIIEAIGKNNDFKTHRKTLKNNNVFSSDNKTINKVVQGTCTRKNAHSVTDEKQPIEFSSSRHKFRKRSDSVSSEKHCRGEDDSKLHKKRSSSDRERKRSVSFCEDKDTDPNSSQSFEMKAEKPKTVRQPRKSIRRESHNSGVELFEPALFSQPDVMVKIKCLESMERKDDFTKKNCFDDMDGIESVEKLSSKDTDEKHGVMENVENKSQFQTVNNCKKELSLTSNHGSLNVDTKTMIVKNDRENPFKSGKLDKKGEFILKSEAMLSTSEKFLNNSSEILEVYHDSCLDVKSDCQEEKLNTKLPIPAENKYFVTFPASDIVTCEKSGLPSTEVENRLPVEGFCDAPETIADIEEALKAEIPNEFLEMLTMGTMPSSVVLAKPITSKSNACIIPERKSPRNLQRSKRTRYGDSPTSVMEDKKMIKDKSKKSIDSPRKSKRNVKEMKVPEIDDENEEDKESESSDDPEDSDWSSEDDPEKLWCLCRKPHNHRFMIQCDSCQEWFHGSCVGVSRQQGRQLEKQKKEWKCPHCIAVETTHKPHQVPTINVSKHAAEKQETIHEDIELKKIRSERKKSEILVKSSPTKKLSDPPLKREKERKPDGEKFHAINKIEMRKLKEETGNVTINDKIKTKTILTDKIDRVDKSKVLQVKEKVIYDKDKHSKLKPTSEKQHLFPSSEKVTSKNDQNSINKATKLLNDALVAKRNTPSHKDSKLTKSNLSKKNQCLMCSKPSHPNASYCSDTCLEKHVIESLKSIQEHEGPAKAMSDMITRKVVVLDRSSGQLINGPSAPTQGEVLSWLKEHPTYEILYPNPPNSTKKEKKTQPVVEQKESQEEVGPESIRFNVRKTLKNTLESRCKNANDAILPEDEVRKIAIRIEEELYKLFKDTGTRYKSKYRSLMFNIKDPRNQGLFRKILKGKIPADRLVRMTTDELASVELAKWREKENQHVLDMIKREQLEQQHQAATVHITKKTHKGEVEIEDESGVAIEESFPKLSQKATDDSAELANQEVQKDSTNNHRSHLFDLNCKICTGKVAPPPAEEPLPKKMRVAHSISMDYSSSSASDTVEKNVSRIVGGEPPSPPLDNTDDSADREPSSTVSIGSPDSGTMPRHSSGKTMSSVWKGFIFMQEVAKFVTSAYKVSGPTDFLFQDIPDTIQVCGRIIPDQVWDYLSKIKQSGNKELTVIRFQAANEEENHLYTQFYSYLHTRKRYGVVSGYSKMIKDFYILPLAGYNPVPTVLMPFDGPGLDAVRTHLLLGVIVRHRTRPLSSTSLPSPPLEEEGDICEGSYTPPIERDSYTPPLPAIASPDQVTISSSSLAYYPSRELKSSSSFAEGFDKAIPSYFPSSKENALKRPLEEELSYERSFTPPIESMPKMEDNSFCAKDEDSCLPYDPGEYISGTQSPTSKNIRDEQPSVYNSYTGNTTITNLIKRLTENSCASNNSAISTPTCLKDYEGNQNVYFNKRPKDSDNSNSQSGDFEDNDNNITSMSPMSPDDHVMNAQSPPESPEVENSLQCMNNSGMSSFLDLPQNLQDILNTVKYEQEKIEKAANTDFDQRYFPSFPVESRLDSDASDRSAADIDYRSQSSSQEGSPPPYDKNTNIILRPSDPRIKIRTSFDETVPGMNSVTDATKSSLSSMSASELVERAQKQLEEMEASESTITSHVETDPGSNQNTLGFAPQYHDKLWHSMSEPPPPGIDPTDLSHVDSIAYSNKSAVGDASLPSVDHVITPPYPPLSGLPESHSLGPTYLPPIIPNTMQPPPNFVPPQHPRIEAYQNQPPVTVLKQFPPSLPPNVPPPTFPPPPLALPPPKTIASQPPPIWPPPGHPPVDVDWRTRPSHWEDHWGDWDMRPMAEGDRNRLHTDYFEEHPQQTYWDDEREHLNWHHGRNRSHRQGWRDRDLEHDRNYRWDRNHQGDNSNHWNMRPRRGNRRNDHWRGNRRNFNHRQPH